MMTIFTFGGQKSANIKNFISEKKGNPFDQHILIGGSPIVLAEQFKGKVDIVMEKFPKILGEMHPFNFEQAGQIAKKLGYINAIIEKYVDYIVGAGITITSKDERAKTIITDWIQNNNFNTILRPWIREALIKGNSFLELAAAEKGKDLEIKLLNSDNIYIERDDLGVIKKYKQYWGMNLNKAILEGTFKKEEIIEFTPGQIAHLAINKHSDMVYGLGLIYPALHAIDDWVKADKDMHMLLGRKANSPIVAKIGDIASNEIPNDNDIAAFRGKLEVLKNNQEWVVGPTVDMKVLDFGKIGEKFDFVMTYDRDEIHSIFQVPAVLMGLGNISEGLAKVQMQGFMMNIRAKQDEIEKVIEEKIFRNVLNNNGMDIHVEVDWGYINEEELRAKTMVLGQLLGTGTQTSPEFKKALELQVGKLLGFTPEELQTVEDQKDRELDQPQPIVPGQNNPMKQSADIDNDNASETPLFTTWSEHEVSKEFDKLKEEEDNSEWTSYEAEKLKDSELSGTWLNNEPEEKARPEAVAEVYNKEFIRKNGDKWCVYSHQTGKNFGCYGSEEQAKKRLAQIHAFSSADKYDIQEKTQHILDGEINIREDMPIQEWIGVNYQKYIEFINRVIDQDKFVNLKADNQVEKVAGYLTNKQIDKMRQVFKSAFDTGQNLRTIAERLKNDVKIKDLMILNEKGEIQYNDNEDPAIRLDANTRSEIIARTETTRLAGEAQQDYYKDQGIGHYRWVASLGQRTCQVCEDLNGQIFETGMGPQPGDPHILCRCTTVGVTEG